MFYKLFIDVNHIKLLLIVSLLVMTCNLLLVKKASATPPKIADKIPVGITELDNATQHYSYSSQILIRVDKFEQAVKLFKWLDLIQLTDIGKNTLNAIENSGHQLLIYHSQQALYSAGTTGAPLSENLINGIGENVYIKFYLDMESHGTNCVLGSNGKYIEYTAVQNLFHELSHARHKMNGSWLYFDSEGQAIRDENIFRLHWAEYRVKEYFLRLDDIDDEEVTFNTRGICENRKSS